MFGLEFGFATGLLALPLAGLPILLHLLFRRKSPVGQFSTLRFIKTSLRHTAARRKVQRWLLLACRALLLALLVWAIAQPAVRPASAWTGSGRSTVAVIVLDTSYSMQLQEQQTTLLARADATVRDLLDNQLRGAKVAILRSSPAPADRPEAEELRLQETFRDSAKIRWTASQPQPAPKPLVDRAALAVAMLEKRDADDKWLVVISDFQRKEFPRPLPPLAGGRVVLIDLHPEDPRSAGVTRVALDPPQPTPGANTQAVVDVSGRPERRAAGQRLGDFAGRQSPRREPPAAGQPGLGRPRPPAVPAASAGPRVAADRRRFATAGAARLGADALLPVAGAAPAARHADRKPRAGGALRPVRLGMDPSEGRSPAWALSVRQGEEVPADANVIVLMLTDWPDVGRAGRLLEFVRGGGTLIWFARPGLEQTWAKLPDAQRQLLAQLLPGTPLAAARMSPENTVAIAAANDPALRGLTDPRYQLEKVTVYRYLPMGAIDPHATTLLNAFPASPAPGERGHGLAFRRPAGAGTAFTIATLPQREYTSLYLNPTFAPMLVQMSLRPPERCDAQNVEVGQPLTFVGPKSAAESELRVQGPQNDLSVVKPTNAMAAGAGAVGGTQFVYDRDDAPGLYAWRRPADGAVLAMGNVQLPGSEAELIYTPAKDAAAPGDAAVVARSAGELAKQFEALRTPKPRWTLPIGAVMILMCLEALMGGTAGVWKTLSLRAFVPGLRTEGGR